ncbi:SDR family NAD(P)-dependent oxidoreductase [Yoonia sp. 2307UL14-13]|uniref:SDR family NAD(P)-dependent oxidoreductase n=1 Tax=Yoonia sp. 2307UL14-13 TaxID=3126506 RepID=UPI0030982272
MRDRTILVTGAAGFIGFHLCNLLLDEGMTVVGVDSLNDYYDPTLKTDRNEKLIRKNNYIFSHSHVEEQGALQALFEAYKPDIVVHLAAQAGVRYSIENPRAYTQANLMGTFELLEAMRAHPPKHALLASTSSAYGANTTMPYRETDQTDHQMSYYAATKKATEAMAHSYAHLFDLPITMFRFFTVYGPWGRPDMAPYLFTSAILKREPIKVFNHGDMQRDFTFVTDLVRGIRLLMDVTPARPKDGIVPTGDSLSPVAPWRIVNIGNGETVRLLDFIEAIETASGRKADKRMLPIQPGDVPTTWADTTLLRKLTGFKPETNATDGVKAYVDWHIQYYDDR